MNLPCHAILRSGEMCRAAASTIVKGSPSCDRPRHYQGEADFVSLSPESVYPHKYSRVVVVLEFLAGASPEEIAIKHHRTRKQIEDMIREAF